MKVCIVVEGCYPYVTGGVSSWVHGLIQSFPKLEFIILAIISNRSLSGKFTYELPENVSEGVGRSKTKHFRLGKKSLMHSLGLLFHFMVL